MRFKFDPAKSPFWICGSWRWLWSICSI